MSYRFVGKGHYAILKYGDIVTKADVFDDFMLSEANLTLWDKWWEKMQPNLIPIEGS